MSSTSTDVKGALGWHLAPGSLAKLRSEIPPLKVPGKLKGMLSSLKALTFFNKQVAPKQEQSLVTPAPQQRNRFMEAAARVYESPHYEKSSTSEAPYGYFRGRHIIGECTQMSGGIFVGATMHEAVVIDEKYGLLAPIFEGMLDTALSLKKHRIQYEQEIFAEVLDIVRKTLKFDREGVEKISQQERVTNDEKIALDVYVQHGIGVARHQVLLAAYLLEKLRTAGIISGIPAIDNYISDSFPEREMLIYTTEAGHHFKFDPVERSIGEQIH